MPDLKNSDETCTVTAGRPDVTAVNVKAGSSNACGTQAGPYGSGHSESNHP